LHKGHTDWKKKKGQKKEQLDKNSFCIGGIGAKFVDMNLLKKKTGAEEGGEGGGPTQQGQRKNPRFSRGRGRSDVRSRTGTRHWRWGG